MLNVRVAGLAASAVALLTLVSITGTESGPVTETPSAAVQAGPSNAAGAVVQAGPSNAAGAVVQAGPTEAVVQNDSTAGAAAVAEGRGHFKKMMMNPYMLIPQLISLGFAPIVLANLKMMVMSALMINNMALNAAIFMTIRNIVFGPRPTTKYTNYGYRHPPHHHRDHQQSHHGGHHQTYKRDDEQPLAWPEESVTSDRRRKRKTGAFT